jgi:uncharacterized protein YqgV (UPF0045/DUF77 family)
MEIAVQISLYPLRQTKLSPAIDSAIEVLRKQGLDVRPGVMSTLVIGQDDAVFEALKEIFLTVGEKSELVMVATCSNACPVCD